MTPLSHTTVGIGSDRVYQSNFFAQVVGLAKRKLHNASNDLVTIPLLLFPMAAAIAAAALYENEVSGTY